jgi:hypothetical protein
MFGSQNALLGGTIGQSVDERMLGARNRLVSDAGYLTFESDTRHLERIIFDSHTTVNVEYREMSVTIESKRLGAEGGTRTPTSCLTRPSNVRVCQFRHFGMK